MAGHELLLHRLLLLLLAWLRVLLLLLLLFLLPLLDQALAVYYNLMTFADIGM